ncbi:unnamed protein product [Prorocentrum cordatum]|uniref:Phospholipase B-like n=1 Tax=Prorocentrum cordatum TaxID=2364126 RepID=A0ABN9TEY1_9DINO|nr:unnamed protein product [Polarella glacialis]
MMGDDARSHWARLLWRRLAPEAAARLAWHLRCAGAELSECAVCRGRRVTLEQLEEHLVSLGHLANLAMSVSHAAAEEGVSWYDRAGGEHGDRVQHFVGLQGRAWFNHITGESDSTLNDGVVARPEWTCYDYAQAHQPMYWYHEPTRRYFEVHEDPSAPAAERRSSGRDRGVWHHVD